MSRVLNETRNDQLGELAATVKLHGWTSRTVVAAAGLIGGLLAVALGAVMTVVSWMVKEGTSLHMYGTLLLILTMPLLIVGAHFLDLQEAATKRNRKHAESHTLKFGRDKSRGGRVKAAHHR